MANTVFHIGYPKTATTTLQNVMISHPECRYLGKGIRENLEEETPSKTLADFVFFRPEAEFLDALPRIKELIHSDVARCTFVSDEAFSFAKFMRIGAAWNKPVAVDHKATARRLWQIDPEATVVVTLRNQADFLESWYLQNFKLGLVDCSFHEFLQGELDKSTEVSLLNALDYYGAIKLYRELFCAERVHVSFFERVRDDFAAYLASICEVATINADLANTIWSGAQLNKRDNIHPRARKLIRSIPRSWKEALPSYLKKQVLQNAPRTRTKVAWNRDDRVIVDDFFRDSNGKLSKLLGVEIEALGYTT